MLTELAVAGFSFTDESNNPGDCEVSIRTVGVPNVLAATEPWRNDVVLVGDDGNVLWGGYIFHRQGDAASGVLTVYGRQFEGYFDRIWLPDSFDGDGEGDAANLIWQRVEAVRLYAESLHFVPFIQHLPEPEPSGVSASFSFKSTAADGVFVGEPPSVLSDIRTITSQGVRFALRPVLEAGVLVLRLEVEPFPMSPGSTLTVGVEVSDVEVAVDAARRVTHVTTVGADSTLLHVSQSIRGPLLMASLSLPTVENVEVLRTVGDAFLAQNGSMSPSLRSPQIPGLLTVRAGDLLRVNVPAGMFPDLWPSGVVWSMRVASAEWSGGAESPPLTRLNLADPIVAENAAAVQPSTLPAFLADVEKNVRRSATRR